MAPSFRDFIKFAVLATLASVGAGLAVSLGAWTIGL